MSNSKPTVLVTGAAGNLGTRLLQQLEDFNIVAVDLAVPDSASVVRFVRLDLGTESACGELVLLLKETRASAVVHLAFVIDPVRTGVLDVGRQWQINVAGTARVMEAITECNRSGGSVRTFIFPSSVTSYGSDLERPATEETRLAGHTLPYAIHKREADEVVQFRAASLGNCRAYILRPHIFMGASVENYIVGMLRGTPSGRGPRAERMRQQGKKLPLVLPRGESYLQKEFQFVHVDDVARLIAKILRTPPAEGTTILNVAGRGAPVTIGRCVEIAGQKLVRLPGKAACRAALKLMWNLGISGVPPEALDYMTGSFVMNTSRLRAFLGSDYESVIRFTVEEALKDTFRNHTAVQLTAASK